MLHSGILCRLDQGTMSDIIDVFARLLATPKHRMNRSNYSIDAAQRKLQRFPVTNIGAYRLSAKRFQLVSSGNDTRHYPHLLTCCEKTARNLAPQRACSTDDENQPDLLLSRSSYRTDQRQRRSLVRPKREG